jgi:F0F1-type ATP synthase membrane subunit c/vacuolar-type H+-ATPase subunit K
MATTCERHPDTETRLACTTCGTPVCARCAVPAPVGQKCPACAKQARTARAQGKPRQYAKGAAAGAAAAAGVAVGLALLIAGVGWLYIIASGFGGYAVARAVQWGAEGNRASPFRLIAFALAFAAIQGAWLILGVLVPSGLGIATYLAAVYGAYLVYR